MKKIFFCAVALFAGLVTFDSCRQADKAADADSPGYEIVSYVYSVDDVMPDPNLMTTVNYCFTTFNDSLDGFNIANEPRLRSIIALREINPDLKVLVCIGGSSESGFSVIAADSAKRASLAANCKRVIEEFDLDGIDFDWEFPCQRGGTPDDHKNFLKLLTVVRDSIGDDKLLTLAAGGDLAGLDVDNIPPYLDLLDYINVMAYDLGGQAPWHHTALYRSERTGWRSVDEVVEDYVNHGIPYDKMMLGLGFYGRGDDNYYTGWTDSKTARPYGDLTEQWDSVAMVPYIADTTGTLVCGYENPRSIEIKCDYLKDKGFRGAMIWRTELDLDSMELAKTVAHSLLNKN